jgi:SAM-dependent methyltransferase
MKDEAYDAFAYAYDAALGERFFRAVRRLLNRAIERYKPERTHLDVACGTGLAIESLRGFASTGVDLSLPMLEVARRRTSRVVAADVRALPLRGTFGLITCLYDSLNHLDELEAAFAQIRSCMDARSIFAFDMNDPEIYPAIWGMAEPFVAEGADYHLEIATKFDRQTAIGDALVRGWAMVAGERITIEERHRQRAHSAEDMEAALAQAGINPIEVIDFDPFGEARRVKLFYVCRAS